MRALLRGRDAKCAPALLLLAAIGCTGIKPPGSALAGGGAQGSVGAPQGGALAPAISYAPMPLVIGATFSVAGDFGGAVPWSEVSIGILGASFPHSLWGGIPVGTASVDGTGKFRFGSTLDATYSAGGAAVDLRQFQAEDPMQKYELIASWGSSDGVGGRAGPEIRVVSQ